MPKLQKRPTRFEITIPKEIVERKGWQGGEILYITLDDNDNVIIKE